MSLVTLDGLSVMFGEHIIVDDVDLSIAEGEIVCLVGESGSGKTTTALAAFGWCAPGLSLSGEVTVAGVQATDRGAARSIRGNLITYVPQNPSTALNPAYRVVDTLKDMLRGYGDDRRVSAGLATVGLPAEPEFARRYAHQLSGGQQQRVCIAAALASDPRVVVLDEPTTGLDVVTQAKILDELLRLREQESVAMLYITHDLAVAAKIADRIVVMYGGYVVEQGPAAQVLARPKHPYTRALMAATPDHRVSRALEVLPGLPVDPTQRPEGCVFAPRCTQRVDSCETQMPAIVDVVPGHGVRCSEWRDTPVVDWTPSSMADPQVRENDPPVLEVSHLKAFHATRGKVVTAAEDISFTVKAGQCVALVGESGSGKTTIARSVVGLHRHWSGSVRIVGEEVAQATRKRTRQQLQRVQMVFQNPSDTLNPCTSVAETIARSAMTLRGLGRRQADAEVVGLLAAVHLPARYASRFPRELSGGQRQRVAIARALAAHPHLLVCDEITSALDVSVQAVVLEVLNELRRAEGVGLLFITHDLGVVSAIADEVQVLEDGLICESGPVRQVLDHPRSEYTRRLLAAAPSLYEHTDGRM